MGECIEAGELEAVDNITPLPPAVVNQHSQPPRQFIVLTTQVITMFFTLTCPASHVFTFSLSHSLILWSIPLSSIHSQLYVITYTYVQSKREKEEGKIVGGWRRYGIIPVFSFPFWGFPPFYLLKMLFIAHPQGSYILTKPRPVDQLSSLLEQYRSSTCDAVEQFFHLHGQSQACAMCLILAAGPNREVSIWLPSKLWTKNVDLHV